MPKLLEKSSSKGVFDKVMSNYEKVEGKKDPSCKDCNLSFTVLIETNQYGNLCFRCFRNRFGNDQLSTALSQMERMDTLKGWQSQEGKVYVDQDLIDRAYTIFQAETLQIDYFNPPTYDMSRPDQIEASTFLMSIEQSDKEELEDLKNLLANDEESIRKLDEMVHERCHYILVETYGKCTKCNKIPLNKKQKSKYSDRMICHVCRTTEIIEELKNKPLMSEQEYEIFYSKNADQMASRNKDYINQLTWMEYRLRTENDLVQNFVRQRLHGLEKHPIDQRGWCHYCDMWHRMTPIPKSIRDVLESCEGCCDIVKNEDFQNEEIAHRIKKHIKSEHKDIYKIVTEKDTVFYQWAFITPEEDERRQFLNWKKKNPYTDDDEFRKEREKWIKRHHPFSREDTLVEDPNQVFPSMKGYPMYKEHQSDSDFDKSSDLPEYRTKRFETTFVEEFAEESSKELNNYRIPELKSELKRYADGKAEQVIMNYVKAYTYSLVNDFEKPFDKIKYKNKLDEFNKKLQIHDEMGTLEKWLTKLRVRTKIWKKETKRSSLVALVANEIWLVVKNEIADNKETVQFVKKGIHINDILYKKILKKYELSDHEKTRILNLVTRIVQDSVKRSLIKQAEEHPLPKESWDDFEKFAVKELYKIAQGYQADPKGTARKTHEVKKLIVQKAKEILDLDKTEARQKYFDISEKLQEYSKEKEKRKVYLTEHDPIVQKAIAKKVEKIDFTEFKELLKEKQIFNKLDYQTYLKTEVNPAVPKNPETFYKKQGWHGWRDATGYVPKKPALTQEVIEQIKQEIKDNWDLYTSLEEGMIIYMFDLWGVFGIKDPVERAWFNEFVKWKDVPKKSNAIWDYLNIGDKNIIKERIITTPDKRVETRDEYLDQKFSGSYKEIPLFRTDTETIQDVIQKSDHYIPTIKDDRLNKFMRLKFVKNIWISFFDNPNQDLSVLQRNGLEFHDRVIDDFERQYMSVTNDDLQHWTALRKFYKFSKGQPKLMQRYGAFMLLTIQGLLNMFGTGTGKTLCAILGSKVINAKHVFWICPKSTIDQTKEMIMDAFPDISQVTTVLDSNDKSIPSKFFEDTTKKGHEFIKNGKYRTNYHIVNYDQFSQTKNGEMMQKQLMGKKIELFVLDESQMVKNRYETEEQASKRRDKIIAILNNLRLQNQNMRVLMLSATPIVNNVKEFMSLHKMLSGTDLAQHGMSGYTNVKNGARMYVESQPFSLRYEAKYDIDIEQPITECFGFLPDEMSDDTARETPFIQLETFLTEVRIPYMLKKFREIREKNPNEKLVLYTHYVGAGIIDKLQTAFINAGYRTGVFYGEDKSGWVKEVGKDFEGKPINEYPFKEGKLDVLIAGRTFQIGVDGAQYVCKNIFFNGFVWTPPEFEQTKGRLIRSGQSEKKVYVHMFFATVNNFRYDYEVKFLRVLRKQAMGDLCKDGRLPKDVALGEEKEKAKAIEKMLQNRKSGFPTKEKLKEMHAEEAQKQIKTELDELQKKFPKATFDLGEGDN